MRIADKTPLFEELESELLQQEINDQTAEAAYAKYMRGFEEVANLKIAGCYHDTQKDTLHLFGVKPSDPPTYYYRAIQNTHREAKEPNCGILWSHWQKIDVQIPVRKVSPIVFCDRLYVFWVEITTTPKNELVDGSSEFVGYQHKMSLKFTRLQQDGTWTASQKIDLYGVDPFEKGDGVVDDPIVSPGEYVRSENDVTNLGVIQHIGKEKRYPRKLKYGNLYYLKEGDRDQPKDGYTLTGYQWEQIQYGSVKHFCSLG